MTPRTSGRIVGALFLAAFVFYGVGSALGRVPGGVMLVLLNSVAVVVIGFLVRGRLKTDSPRVAEVYWWARMVEAVLLAAGVLFMLAGREEVDVFLYTAAMVVLAVGSIPLWPALSRLGWIPSWFSLWGVLGYELLALGVLLDPAIPGIGMFLAVPGGLFEIAFGILLLRAGFPAQSDAVAASRSR